MFIETNFYNIGGVDYIAGINSLKQDGEYLFYGEFEFPLYFSINTPIRFTSSESYVPNGNSFKGDIEELLPRSLDVLFD